MIQGIITKTGNSYAIRVPKSYIVINNLHLGDKVDLMDLLSSQRASLQRLVQAGQQNGPVLGMGDPVSWQRQQRRSDDPWESTRDDTAR